MHQTQTNRVGYYCKHCGVYKKVPASRKRGKFCGLPCFYKYNRGENNANWLGGVTPERQEFYATDEWKDCVRTVWKRDGAKCQRCFISFRDASNESAFHIHHIISFKHKKYRADINNLLLVCEKCHRWIHSRHNKSKDFISKPN
ncbi:HNH endonuclease signature motif containing protein [Gilliamella sp.]|uniref:HNH endonuclease n=1 Tax=Gilliamella sp. TaxID=1891236 RepID=UPI00345AE904